MDRRRMHAALGVAGGAALLAVASCAAPPASDPKTSPEPDTTAEDPGELLAALTTDQGPEDELPPDGDGGQLMEDSGVAPETSRRLGSTDDGEFWAVLTDEDDLCLVAVLAGDTASGSSCGAPEQFAERGTWVTVHAQGESVEAYLVPDALAVEEVPDGLTEVTPWLVAGISSSSGDTLSFIVPDDADTSLEPIEMPLR